MVEWIEWTNGWTVEWMNGWMENGWTVEWLNGWMDEWWWMDEWLNGWMVERLNGRMVERLNGWTVEWMNEWRNGWMDLASESTTMMFDALRRLHDKFGDRLWNYFISQLIYRLRAKTWRDNQGLTGLANQIESLAILTKLLQEKQPSAVIQAFNVSIATIE
jgi:hypothetical protein